MRKVDKFKHLRFVAAVFKQICPHGIGKQSGKALLNYTVAGEQRKAFCRKLIVELVLTAGHGKNHFGVPVYCVIECKIRCGIAGVKSYYHINVKRALVAVYIAKLKTQVIIAVFLRRLVTLFDYVLFQVKADYVCLDFSDFGKIVVNDKGEIRFAAAEVNNIQLFVIVLLYAVVNQLDKAVNLPVLVVHRLHYPALFCEYAHIH